MLQERWNNWSRLRRSPLFPTLRVSIKSRKWGSRGDSVSMLCCALKLIDPIYLVAKLLKLIKLIYLTSLTHSTSGGVATTTITLHLPLLVHQPPQLAAPLSFSRLLLLPAPPFFPRTSSWSHFPSILDSTSTFDGFPARRLGCSRGRTLVLAFEVLALLKQEPIFFSIIGWLVCLFVFCWRLDLMVTGQDCSFFRACVSE